MRLPPNRNYQILAKQCKENNVKTVCIYDEKYYNELKVLLDGTGTKILTGMEGLCEIAADISGGLLLNSVVGMVGLLPTLTRLVPVKILPLPIKKLLLQAEIL